MPATDAKPFFDFITAQAPVTCGADIEVPDAKPKPVPQGEPEPTPPALTDEQMLLPGAHTSVEADTLENEETLSDLVCCRH